MSPPREEERQHPLLRVVLGKIAFAFVLGERDPLLQRGAHRRRVESAGDRVVVHRLAEISDLVADTREERY